MWGGGRVTTRPTGVVRGPRGERETPAQRRIVDMKSVRPEPVSDGSDLNQFQMFQQLPFNWFPLVPWKITLFLEVYSLTSGMAVMYLFFR